jgi:hypothetical protein
LTAYDRAKLNTVLLKGLGQGPSRQLGQPAATEVAVAQNRLGLRLQSTYKSLMEGLVPWVISTNPGMVAKVCLDFGSAIKSGASGWVLIESLFSG